MPMKFAMAVCVAAQLCFPVAALANEPTGNDMLKNCEISEFACTLYVVGVVQGFRLANEINTNNTSSKVYCAPSKVTFGQIGAIFEKYLSDHPEKLHLGATVLLLTSLNEAFPC